MGTPNPGARGDAGLGTRLSRLEADLAQLRRLITRQPKIPAPVAAPVATGGGVVGMAEVRSKNGSVTWAAGQFSMSYTEVTYDAPIDPNSGGGGAASSLSWVNPDGHQILLEPGWYIPVLTLAVIWTNGGAPAAFGGPYMNGGWDSVHNNYPISPLAPMGATAGFVQVANFGPTYVQEGGDLHAELRALGGSATAGNEPSQSYAIWNITKLG